MSDYKPWKAFERRHAKRLLGQRLWRPDFSDSQPDGENEKETWDTKAWSRQRIVAVFEECERKYREFTGGRNFHLGLFDPTRRSVGDLVVCRASRYAELLDKERMVDGILEALLEFDSDKTCYCAETSSRNCPEHAPT